MSDQGAGVPPRLTHVDERGAARMVDVGEKEVTSRSATATGRVLVSADVVALLRGVYASAALLQADTAALLRIVPSGCGLRGVRTTYHDVRVTEGADRAVVTAQAVLPPSTLLCAGAARGEAAGVGPTAMRVVLVGPPSSARIAEQQQA